MKIDIIQIEQIDQSDYFYRISFAPNLERLEQSMRAVGVLHPVIVEQLPETGRYRVVAGFQRVWVAQRLKITHLPAQIFTAGEQTPLKLFELALFENLTQQPFNPIEQALVMHKLVNRLNIPRDIIIKDYLPVIGLGTNPQLIDRYLQLLTLDDKIQLAIARDLIGIDFAVKLAQLSESDQQFLFQLIQELKLGKNRQKEFYNLFYDLSRLYDCSFTEIARRIHIDEIRKDEKAATPVITERIRTALKRLRLPNLTNVEEHFQSIIRKLKLPRNVQITPFPFFEDDQFTVKFDFRNQEEFKKYCDLLNRIASSQELKALEELV